MLGMADHPTPETDELLTPADVAGVLKLDIKTIRRWRYEGKGPAWFPLGLRTVRYRRSEVDAWIEARETAGRPS